MIHSFVQSVNGIVVHVSHFRIQWTKQTPNWPPHKYSTNYYYLYFHPFPTVFYRSFFDCLFWFGNSVRNASHSRYYNIFLFTFFIIYFLKSFPFIRFIFFHFLYVSMTEEQSNFYIVRCVGIWKCVYERTYFEGRPSTVFDKILISGYVCISQYFMPKNHFSLRFVNLFVSKLAVCVCYHFCSCALCTVQLQSVKNDTTSRNYYRRWPTIGLSPFLPHSLFQFMNLRQNDIR